MIFGWFKSKADSRVKCVKCRAKILEQTANRCGGLCMPCFKKANNNKTPDELERKKTQPVKSQNYVQAIAKVLLRDAYPQYAKHAQLLKNDPKQYEALNLTEKYDFGPEEWIDCEELAQESFLEAYSQALDFTLNIDWSGEDDTWDLFNLIQTQLKALNKPPWNRSMQTDWEEQLDWQQLERGDYILKKFQLFGDKLAEDGLVLAFINNGGDCYLPFILTQDEYKTIPKQHPTESYYLVCDYKSL